MFFLIHSGKIGPSIEFKLGHIDLVQIILEILQTLESAQQILRKCLSKLHTFFLLISCFHIPKHFYNLTTSTRQQMKILPFTNLSLTTFWAFLLIFLFFNLPGYNSHKFVSHQNVYIHSGPNKLYVNYVPSCKILLIPGRQYLHTSTPPVEPLGPGAPIPLLAGKVVGFSLLRTSEIQNNSDCFY